MRHAFCLLILGAATPASAHFLQALPDADVLPDGGQVTIDLTFTHPFDGGPVMEMERPVQVGVMSGGHVTDLQTALTERPVDGAMAWRLNHDLIEPGANVFYVQPQPYWEPAEQKSIIHYTKVIVDSFASGDGWDQLVGFPVEILPLTRPTGLWQGNSFTGVVLRDGVPAPFAEIEVEYVNTVGLEAPNDAFVTQVLRTDVNGTFTYTMPFAGWWGFAALIDGPQTPAPDGTMAGLELGGLIWVHTTAREGH